MSTLCQNYEYRMALEELVLPRSNFFLLNIPQPSNVIFQDYSEISSHGRGGKSKYGFSHVTFHWEKVLTTSTARIRKIIDQVLAGEKLDGTPLDGYLYLTFDRNDGKSFGRGWVDAYGTPHPLEVTPIGEIAGSSGSRGHESVTLKVNDIQIINEPSLLVYPDPENPYP